MDRFIRIPENLLLEVISLSSVLQTSARQLPANAQEKFQQLQSKLGEMRTFSANKVGRSSTPPAPVIEESSLATVPVHVSIAQTGEAENSGSIMPGKTYILPNE